MLGLQIGTEFLELTPGAALEMERANPFLQFSDALEGEYSLPLTISLTPKNEKLLKYAGLLQTQPNPKGADVICHDSGLQHSSGKLKVDQVNHNLNRPAAGTASLYYLTGLSAFAQDAKDKKLQACDFGGDRSFAYDHFDPNGNGFWGHIHQVLHAAPASFDYAFYPVINKTFDTVNNFVEVMNKVHVSGGQVYFDIQALQYIQPNPVVPFPYLKYVLVQAMASVGWRVDGDILNDPDFVKITMLNFKSIDFIHSYIPYMITGGGGSYVGTITFNLKDHVPPDLLLTDFLIALKNRFAWSYEFDAHKKVMRIDKLKALVGTTYKDYTQYASPLVTKKVLTDKQIYSLKNDFTGEYAAGQGETPGGARKEDLFFRSLLPPPSNDVFGDIHLIVSENNFYVCNTDDAGNYVWVIYKPNIYDVVPKDSNQEITTKAVTVGVEKYDDYLELVPRFENEGFFIDNVDDITWGINLLFYHGLQLNNQNQQYPFASNTIYGPLGNQVGFWSLAFQAKSREGADIGLYDLNWKTFLDAINTSEEIDVTLMLPRTEYMKLKFSDIIVIQHVRMFIKKIKHNIPYGKQVALECSRI